MFGLSVPELILVGGIALIVFGPEKLPEIASKLGRIAGELKKHSDAFRREFYNSVYQPISEAELQANRFKRDLLAGTCEAKDDPGVKETGVVAGDAQTPKEESHEERVPLTVPRESIEGPHEGVDQTEDATQVSSSPSQVSAQSSDKGSSSA